MASLLDEVRAAAARLEHAGLERDEARHSAETLARAALGWSAADWLSRSRESGPPAFSSRFASLVDRRARREPVAYILGEREFYGRTFVVTPAVLIPRPETELVVEEALREKTSGVIYENRKLLPTSFSVVDVGTGSGCIAVTLALEAPGWRLVATDTSAAALAVARENARRLGAADRVECRPGPFLAGTSTPVDLIVSNPPYVAEGDRASLAADVRDYEPSAALFGGADGLDVIRELIDVAGDALGPDGALILEIGLGQAAAVQDLINASRQLTVARIREDLQQIPRVVVARRTS